LPGREIQTLVDGEIAAGVCAVSFDETRFANMIKLCRLPSGGNSATKKLIQLKEGLLPKNVNVARQSTDRFRSPEETESLL